MIIGITGGTGCGKTTALEVIAQLGGLVLDCDAIYHDLLRTNRDLLGQIAARFPGTVEEGQLLRKKLGQVVFSDPQALSDLNGITHRFVCQAVEEALKGHPPLAAIDAIALVESGLSRLCDVTVAVTAPVDVRVARLMVRDSIPESYARARIAAQPSEDFFRANCDYVLENNGSSQEFREKCLAFFSGMDIMKP